MPEDDLAQSQNHSLTRLHICLIGRLLHDTEALKMYPQRMRRVRQTPMSKSIRSEKVSPLVVGNGFGHGLNREHSKAEPKRQKTDGQYRQAASPCQARKTRPGGIDHRFSGAWAPPC